MAVEKASRSVAQSSLWRDYDSVSTHSKRNRSFPMMKDPYGRTVTSVRISARAHYRRVENNFHEQTLASVGSGNGFCRNSCCSHTLFNWGHSATHNTLSDSRLDR